MRRLAVAILAGLATSGLIGCLAREPIYNAAFDLADAVWGRDAGFLVFSRIVYTTQSVAIAVPGVIVAALVAYRRPVLATACRSCGYDLRGSTSGRCPECGEIAKSYD